MAKRRRGRKAELVIDTIRLLLLLVLLVFVSGSPLLAWFRQRPWAVTLAIIIVVSGMLGLIAFLVTWQQMRRTERLRRLRAENNWLKLTPHQFEE